MKRRVFLILFSAYFLCLYSQRLCSPNGRVCAVLSTCGFDFYVDSVKVLSVPSLGVVIDSDSVAVSSFSDIGDSSRIIESYSMPTGKKSHCINSGFEWLIECNNNSRRELTLALRLYDDGMAFRYIIDGIEESIISGDLTSYFIPNGTPRWMQKWNASYEDFFPYATDGVSDSNKWGYPALLRPAEGIYALISEADIKRYNSASYLRNPNDSEFFHVCFDPNDVRCSGKWESPWRIAILGNPEVLVESTLVADVCPSSALSDFSWVSPGGVSWVYWAYNHGSKDFQIVKKYIDMAECLKLPYVLIDAEWDEMSNGGDIEDALAYAVNKGVKPMIWYNSSTAWLKEWGAPGPHFLLNDREKREKEFARISALGVAGVKIDFFDGDKQKTMDYCIDLLESAARYHLMVNFHGATVPRGWQRTYPHLMSVEGVYGAEWYNNLPVLTEKAALHNVSLVFTRNVIGPMDYTPCTFSDSQHPHITTHAHELALPVLFESALTHWADRPESYLSQPEEVKDFIGSLPCAWDDTKFLCGSPESYVFIARRSNDVWYVAGINGLDEEVCVSMDWRILHSGELYKVRVYTDGSPWLISSDVLSKDQLPSVIRLMPRGGYVAVISKK